MPKTVHDQATTASAQIEGLSATPLPMPAQDIVPLEAAVGPQAQAIAQRLAELDMGNTQTTKLGVVRCEWIVGEVKETFFRGAKNFRNKRKCHHANKLQKT